MTESPDPPLPTAAPDRRALALAQANLVAALAGRAGPPDGFDADRLNAAARRLGRKRRRSAARAWPAFAFALGSAFNPAFDAYAVTTPLADGGPSADARAFGEWLRKRGELPEAGVGFLAVDRASRGWPIRLVGGVGIAVLAVRVPALGVLAAPIRWRRKGDNGARAVNRSGGDAEPHGLKAAGGR